MSSQTSGSLGIGDTGSGNAAYILGLVMIDVMMSRWKGGLVRCRRWDHPFYVLSLLLGNLCWSDCRITTLVALDSIFISCVFIVSL